MRHLRLPVTTLQAGEAGTLGVVPMMEEGMNPNDDVAPAAKVSFGELPRGAGLRLRKGNVFLNPGEWKAYTGFGAVLEESAEA